MNSPDLQITHAGREALRVFERFLEMADSGALFTAGSADSLADLRRQVVAALHRLLVWERPWLEAQRGILWPYQALAERYGEFQRLASDSAKPSRQQQAQLFLGFLPFPRQWSWLRQITREHRALPEVQTFLAAEAQSMAEKLAYKPQRTFKLRHFCQVLKSYGNAQNKGILRVFSIPYLLVALGPQLLERISGRYVLFAEPPMGVVWRHTWWRHYAALADPCVFGIASPEDRAFLEQEDSVEVVPLAHGDFLEDHVFHGDGLPKEYDIVFNATFDDMPRKRHERMLELLQHPLLEDFSALFLGRGSETQVATLEEQVRQLGLAERVRVLVNVRRSEVPDYLARCRMGVHLSLYENACRSVYEFFRADLPCVISSSMAGMNPAVFGDQTGKAVADANLPQAIAFVFQHLDRFAPRRWFVEHSGSENSSRRLNEALRMLFARWGYGWHEDIAPLSSSGANRYARAADYERFREDFQWLLGCLQEAAPSPSQFTLE
jgi:glycosyltransferase involved in cell wall biosynthesis